MAPGLIGSVGVASRLAWTAGGAPRLTSAAATGRLRWGIPPHTLLSFPRPQPQQPLCVLTSTPQPPCLSIRLGRMVQLPCDNAARGVLDQPLIGGIQPVYALVGPEPGELTSDARMGTQLHALRRLGLWCLTPQLRPT